MVNTKIGQSTIHCIGLFAAQDISKGSIIWSPNALLDIKIPPFILMKWPESAQQQIKNYAWVDEDGMYCLCGDDARFFNHSDTPNCDDSGPNTVSLIDIKCGEELTCDYHVFDHPAASTQQTKG